MNGSGTLDGLLAQRAVLLSQLSEVNAAIALIEKGKAVRIRTRQNFRNAPFVTTRPGTPGWVTVWSDKEFTQPAREKDHSGWITAEDAVTLTSGGYVDGDIITLEEDTLVPADEHIEDIRSDLKALGHYVGFPDDKLMRLAVEQGLVKNGMYDPDEARRQYASNIMEEGL